MSLRNFSSILQTHTVSSTSSAHTLSTKTKGRSPSWLYLFLVATSLPLATLEVCQLFPLARPFLNPQYPTNAPNSLALALRYAPYQGRRSPSREEEYLYKQFRSFCSILNLLFSSSLKKAHIV